MRAQGVQLRKGFAQTRDGVPCEAARTTTQEVVQRVCADEVRTPGEVSQGDAMQFLNQTDRDAQPLRLAFPIRLSLAGGEWPVLFCATTPG